MRDEHVAQCVCVVCVCAYMREHTLFEYQINSVPVKCCLSSNRIWGCLIKGSQTSVWSVVIVAVFAQPNRGIPYLRLDYKSHLFSAET